MNAMEHGNGYARRRSRIRVLRDRSSVRVLITDAGGAATLPEREAPDLEAKLAGRQTPRGWGLFLIEELVDATRVTVNGERRARWSWWCAMHELHLTGDIDRGAEAQLEDGYAAARAAGATELRLDFSGDDLHQLVGDRADRGAPRAGPRRPHRGLARRGLSDHYREIFEVTRLADFVTIIDDEGTDHA